MVATHRVFPRLGVALALLLAACRREQAAPAPPPDAASIAVVAPDQARPDELAEGPDKAFGLPIPRRMKVTAQFPDAVFARGPLELTSVTRYVRERVVAEKVETWAVKTVFNEASVKDAPQRLLQIEVLSDGSQIELVVRDRTRPPAEEGLSQEERWRAHGLRPDGTLIDPTHLE
jgi:hypothetical protein